MQLRIRHRAIADVTVLELAGGLTLGDGDRQLQHQVKKLVADGRKKIVFDLTELIYVDSTGLGELVRSYTLVARAGGQLMIYHPFVKPENLLAITKLASVFETVESIADLVPVFDQEALFSRCPRCKGSVSLFFRRDYQACGRCGIEFKVSIPDSVGSHLEVSVIRLAAYEGEPVSLWPNVRPVRIEISGRLDVTAAEVVGELSRLVPAGARRCIVETPANRTDAGWRALVERGLALTIVMRGLTDDLFAQLSGGAALERFEEGYSFAPRTLVVPIRRPAQVSPES